MLGQISTLLWIFSCVFFKSWFLLLLSPFVVYPFAWTGHFLFEKNEPAAWKNPILAKVSDWVMFKDILTGKISW